MLEDEVIIVHTRVQLSLFSHMRQREMVLRQTALIIIAILDINDTLSIMTTSFEYLDF